MMRDRKAVVADLIYHEGWRLTRNQGKTFRAGFRRAILEVLVGPQLSVFHQRADLHRLDCAGVAAGHRVATDYLGRLDRAKAEVRAAEGRVPIPADDASDDAWWEASYSLSHAFV